MSLGTLLLPPSVPDYPIHGRWDPWNLFDWLPAMCWLDIIDDFAETLGQQCLTPVVVCQRTLWYHQAIHLLHLRRGDCDCIQIQITDLPAHLVCAMYRVNWNDLMNRISVGARDQPSTFAFLQFRGRLPHLAASL